MFATTQTSNWTPSRHGCLSAIRCWRDEWQASKWVTGGELRNEISFVNPHHIAIISAIRQLLQRWETFPSIEIWHYSFMRLTIYFPLTVTRIPIQPRRRIKARVKIMYISNTQTIVNCDNTDDRFPTVIIWYCYMFSLSMYRPILHYLIYCIRSIFDNDTEKSVIEARGPENSGLWARPHFAHAKKMYMVIPSSPVEIPRNVYGARWEFGSPL